MRFYGSVINRLMEGRQVDNIKVGMDITMYLWSDRHCYYVVDVINQKEIKVKKYLVCADQDKACGMGHQDWKYFKTAKEHNQYLNSCKLEYDGKVIKYDENPKESEPETWVYRYKKWMKCNKYDLDAWNKLVERCKEDSKKPELLAHYYSGLSDEEIEKIKSGKVVNKYSDLSGKISFGVRDYYYDWEI